MQVGFAEHQRTGIEQALHHGGVARWAGWRAGPACRPWYAARGIEVVFQCQRHAMQRARAAAGGALLVGGARRRTHRVGIVLDEGVQAR